MLANSNMIFSLLQAGIPAFLILLAWFTGRAVERRHFSDLRKREHEFADMVLSDLKTFPNGADPNRSSELVAGQAVIATDYLKTFLAGIRKVFGGELRSYETLMDRSRREATLRMLAQARQKGYNAVCNIRLGFADIGGMAGTKGSVMVEVFAYGTAYCTKPGQD